MGERTDAMSEARRLDETDARKERIPGQDVLIMLGASVAVTAIIVLAVTAMFPA